ncbi:hypothetical protein AAE478_002031 [Parahypoxylon ruwenzoriense]
MAGLDVLPTEILNIIAHSLSSYPHINEPVLNHHDLASLTLVNRRLHDVFDPILWAYSKKYGEQEKSRGGVISAVYWGALENRIDILEKALQHGFELGGVHKRDPIHCAATHGHNATVSWLLDHGVPIDHKFNDERLRAYEFQFINPRSPSPPDHVSPDFSPFYTALTSGQESTALLLLKRGARPQFSSFGRFTREAGIHIAADVGLVAVIEYLVKTMGIDVNQPDHRLDTPLHYAVRRSNNIKTIQTLISLGADINAEERFELPLTTAILRGHYDNAMVLLDAGANVNTTNENVIFPLAACVDVGSDEEISDDQFEVLMRLIKRGADVNARCGVDTALGTAITHGTARVVFALLKAGAGANMTTGHNDCTPLNLVWPFEGHTTDIVGKVSLLVAAGARLDIPEPPHGQTQLENAIHYCIWKSDPRPLDATLRFATRQNMHEGYLDELFQICLEHRHIRPAQVLMRYGATSEAAKKTIFDLAMENNQHSSHDTRQETLSFCLDFGLSNEEIERLFYSALEQGNEEKCQFLISRGVLSLSNEPGPWLHLAAACGSIGLVRRLCRAGMDINALDDKSETPMMAALQADHRDVANVLFELGADPFHPRPSAECRLSPTSTTQIISPFEFAIRRGLFWLLGKWWLDTPMESRPREEFYIPRVLNIDPFYFEYMEHLLHQGDDRTKEDKDMLSETLRILNSSERNSGIDNAFSFRWRHAPIDS